MCAPFPCKQSQLSMHQRVRQIHRTARQGIHYERRDNYKSFASAFPCSKTIQIRLALILFDVSFVCRLAKNDDALNQEIKRSKKQKMSFNSSLKFHVFKSCECM